MPNHCFNTLTVEGPKSIVIIDSLFDDKHNVDFNNVIKMPEQLDIGAVPLKPNETMLKNKKETGYYSWCDWSIENWGTKWNAYESRRVGDNTVEFLTAWSPPIPVIEELSKKYPDHVFKLSYRDEFEEGYHTLVFQDSAMV